MWIKQLLNLLAMKFHTKSFFSLEEMWMIISDWPLCPKGRFSKIWSHLCMHTVILNLHISNAFQHKFWRSVWHLVLQLVLKMCAWRVKDRRKISMTLPSKSWTCSHLIYAQKFTGIYYTVRMFSPFYFQASTFVGTQRLESDSLSKHKCWRSEDFIIYSV